MNFNELDLSLPNGFHDADLRNFEMDYAHSTLTFDLAVWLGKMEPVNAREIYRPARVTVTNVSYLVIEPTENLHLKPDSIQIDTGAGIPKNFSKVPDVPAGTVLTWVFLNAMNSFIVFAGGEASLEWTGPEENWKK